MAVINMPLAKVPVTMATQHPDHANKPYWLNSQAHDKPVEFIPASQESQEVYLAFSQLGIDEYKWDWEGKLVDESVIERLLGSYSDYFKENSLGIDKRLTYRLPNPEVETETRLGRAFMGILSANGLAKSLGMPTPPMDEVILPMCESAHSMISIQEAFREVADLKHWLFGFQNFNFKHIGLVPLFEKVETIVNSDQILSEYITLHKQKFGYTPDYIRPYVARSDPSLNSGHVATAIGIKIAFSKYREFQETTGIELYPIVGCGALLFRGGLKPETIDNFLEQYAGVRTVLIQSGFRYDYPTEVAIEGINKLNRLVPNKEATILSLEDYKQGQEIITIFEKYYRQTVEKIAPLVNQIADLFPIRRERVQHTGLFGYNRGVGKVKLPRAIKFTGSLYSIGLPPSIIGTGRAIKEIQEKNLLPKLFKLYPKLLQDYQVVSGFVNIQNLEKYSQIDGLDDYKKDVQRLTEVLDLDFQPITEAQIKHSEISSKIAELLQLGELEKIPDLIAQSGSYRRSLG